MATDTATLETTTRSAVRVPPLYMTTTFVVPVIMVLVVKG